MSFRTSDRRHWCGNPHPPSLAPLLRGAVERSETEGSFWSFLRVGKPHHRLRGSPPLSGEARSTLHPVGHGLPAVPLLRPALRRNQRSKQKSAARPGGRALQRFFRSFLRVGKPHHRFAVPLPFQGRQGGRCTPYGSARGGRRAGDGAHNLLASLGGSCRRSRLMREKPGLPQTFGVCRIHRFAVPLPRRGRLSARPGGRALQRRTGVVRRAERLVIPNQ